jgi:flagellar motor switch protein FliN/FliY
MTESTVESRIGQLREMLRAAATAAAAALPLAQPPLAAPPVPDAPTLVGGRALAARLTGELSGELVLQVAAPLLEQLAAGPTAGLDLVALLTPALQAAATTLGCTAADVADTEPAAAPVDLAVPFVLGGVPVAALLLRRTPEQPLSAEELPTFSPAELDPTPTRPTVVPVGGGAPAPVATRLDQLTHVEMEVTVEIGRTRMTVGDLLGLTPGQVVELDRAAGAPVDLFVNGTLLARGEIVVVDEDFGFRVTEIVSSREG